MPLIDSLTRRASEMGNLAIQKTKDFSDISRLNAQISEEERRQNEYYSQLGKQYRSLHADDCEELFKPLIHSILESEAKLSELKQLLQNLRGVKRCDACGAEVEKNARFCSICGTPLPQPAPPVETNDMIVCPGCHKNVKKGNRFCVYCGEPIVPSTAEKPEPQQESENSK